MRAARAADVRPLRGLVLRPGMDDEQLRFAGDEDPATLHLAALERGTIVAVASIMREGMPGEPARGDWRVRGMAAAPQVRGRGIGAAMLTRCLQHAREHGGRRVWCNARVAARSLYEGAGFEVLGERFEIPGIGDHYLMHLTVGGDPA